MEYDTNTNTGPEGVFMARTGITYDQVAAAADTIVAAGAKPTLKAIREKLGNTGSPNTIHMHLQKWEAQRPLPPQAEAGMPPAIARAVMDELDRVRAGAQAELLERLDDAQRTADELARSGQQLEAEISEAREQLAELTTDRDRLAGQSAEQQKELERLQGVIAQERQAAEAARVDLAQARLKTEAAEAGLGTLRDERQRMFEMHDQQRDARIAVERDLAGATASLQELRLRVEQMTAQAAAVVQERDQLRDKLERERGLVSQTREQLATEQAKAQAAQERAADLQQRETTLRDELAALRAPVSTTPPPAPPAGAASAAKREKKS